MAVIHPTGALRYTSPMNDRMPRVVAAAAPLPVITAAPQAMDVTHSYWFAMLAASAFGTNVGDLWAELLFPGRFTSLASLLAICAASVWYHRHAAARTEAGYWVAIVAMRAAATNLTSSRTTWRWATSRHPSCLRS
jgi:uncharacterized membrane-anchored protein